MLLRKRHMQPFSRQKKELDHPYVGWQRTGVQGIGIGESGVAAEQPVDHGHDEAPFQQVFGLRLFKRQRGEKGQTDRAVCGRAGVERVDDVIGLAEPER
jgi:hypothetical protein